MRFSIALVLMFVLASASVLVQVPSTLARQSRDSGRYREVSNERLRVT